MLVKVVFDKNKHEYYYIFKKGLYKEPNTQYCIL